MHLKHVLFFLATFLHVTAGVCASDSKCFCCDFIKWTFYMQYGVLKLL